MTNGSSCGQTRCARDRTLASMTLLHIATTDTHEATVIAPVGDLDLGSVGRFDDAIAKAEDQDVIVDLRRVEFMDSTGLSALLRAAHARARNDRTLRVIAGPGCVDRLFDLTLTRSQIEFVDHTVVDAPIAELWLG
jgi:anti-anti-sigma factor